MVQSDQLVVGEISLLAAEQRETTPDLHRNLSELLRGFIDQLGEHYAHVVADFDDASWVGYRLAELLPIPMTRKQYFLELEDPLSRLEQIADIVTAIAQSSSGPS